MEVKFADEQKIFAQLRQGVRSALQKSAFSTVIHPIELKHNLQSNALSHSLTHSKKDVAAKQESQSQVQYKSSYPQTSRIHEVSNPFRKEPHGDSHSPSISKQSDFRELLESDPVSINEFMQVFDTYIIYKNSEGLIMFDQHAVHEKILLEQFINSPEKVRSQVLAIPIIHTIGTGNEDSVVEILDKIPGFDVENFGRGQLIVRSVPTFFQKLAHLEKRVTELIDIIRESSEATHPEDIRTEIFKTIACKSAIKAGKKMTHQEVTALVAQAIHTDFAFSCCHGRPTMIQLNQDWFEKQFSRK
jgi:DNA mismatch repair protein MutL